MAAARHTKQVKTMSQAERELRKHHQELRRFKKWCEKNEIAYMNYEEASPGDICVLSINEFDLEDTRSIIFEDCESIFLTPEDYERWREDSV